MGLESSGSRNKDIFSKRHKDPTPSEAVRKSRVSAPLLKERLSMKIDGDASRPCSRRLSNLPYAGHRNIFLPLYSSLVVYDPQKRYTDNLSNEISLTVQIMTLILVLADLSRS